MFEIGLYNREEMVVIGYEVAKSLGLGSDYVLPRESIDHDYIVSRLEDANQQIAWINQKLGKLQGLFK